MKKKLKVNMLSRLIHRLGVSKNRITTPYIKNNRRLPDVIAAIQVMGTYKFYKADFSTWSDRIEGSNKNDLYWKNIFEQHPEFFRMDSKKEKVSLVWRRNYQKLYDVDREEIITKEDYKKLDEKSKERISRMPLNNSDISTLIETAINLHSREIEYKREKRWWKTPLIGFIGVIIGAEIKATGEYLPKLIEILEAIIK
ncbi:hypothetical protein [Chondrinema litorale]|uniref:hypothetical protein n=1 Tax=Chondrinema litorale TaxID=2994555 RepID=UPI002542DAB4|nr:hypothetical protein [Chondrinema litorale]UZS00200.1 hypothetical protein OQ292_40480 [Chondrinema litorale]